MEDALWNSVCRRSIPRSGAVALKVAQGHFATNHSHINYYIDITTLKTRLRDAEAVARELAQKYVTSTVIDTIVPAWTAPQVIGACLARELTTKAALPPSTPTSPFMSSARNTTPTASCSSATTSSPC